MAKNKTDKEHGWYAKEHPEVAKQIGGDTSAAKRKKAYKEAVEAVDEAEAEGRSTQQLDMVRKELAKRELARRSLVALIVRDDPTYLPGWVHHDIAARLEKFSRDVVEQKSPRLILMLPPRSGKSTLASHYFPAFHLGHNPKHEIIITSHTATLAMKFSRKVRELLRQPHYKQVFEGTELDPNTQSLENWQTTKKGGLLAAGVGGGILGSGAHCLPLWAEVMTPEGPRTVDWLVKNVVAAPLVLSYDGANVVERKINGCITRTSDHYYEVEATGGGFHATGEHPVCVGAEGGQLVYRRVDDLRPGDAILSVAELSSWHEALRGMPGVRGGVHEEAGQVPAERRGLRAAGAHLRERLSGAAAQLAAVGRSGLRRVREAVFGAGQRRGEAAQEHVLQQRLPGKTPEQDLRGREAPSVQPGGACLRAVWSGFHAGAGKGAAGRDGGGTAVLQQGLLRRLVAWRPYAPEQRFPWGQILPVRVQGGPAGDGFSAAQLRSVRLGGEGPPPSGRGQGEQRAGEFGAGVPELPHPAPSSVVTRVTRVERQLTVADFEVDGTHCFVTPSGKVLLNCLIIDDPVKNAEEGTSDSAKEAIWEWYATTAYTRLAPGGGVLVIMQRWAPDDLAGMLESKGLKGEGDAFEVVRYPAIAEQDERFRKQGEALHPERYSLEQLEAIKATQDPWMWSALYQQAPTMEEGDYFKREDLEFYEEGELPRDLTFYSTWDFAISKKERADWTVGLTAGVDRYGDIWLVDLRRGHWDAFEIVDEMLDAWISHPIELMGAEKGQIALALGPYLEREAEERQMFDFAVEELSPGKRDKVQRARSIQGMVRKRKVRIPKSAPWRKELVAELTAFPNGEHDDIVDVLAYLGLMLQELVFMQRGESAGRSPRKKERQWRSRLAELMDKSKRRNWRAA